MAYREEDKTKLKRQSSKRAIALTMQGRWREAVTANKRLLESFPNDVDIHNRLGRAHVELGEYSLAKAAYERAFELDSYNTIAEKNLSRLSHLGETAVSAVGDFHKVEPQQFIEEVGKAGVVNLLQLGLPEILAKAVAGDRLNLKMDGCNLIVENSLGEYLGQVDPKHGQRLIKLMERGNKYTATIISSTVEAVTVIIREVYQDPSQAGKLSFPPKGTESVRSHVGDRIIRRELEYEEALPEEPSYTLIDENGAELLTAENANIDDEAENEE